MSRLLQLKEYLAEKKMEHREALQDLDCRHIAEHSSLVRPLKLNVVVLKDLFSIKKVEMHRLKIGDVHEQQKHST